MWFDSSDKIRFTKKYGYSYDRYTINRDGYVYHIDLEYTATKYSTDYGKYLPQ